jgi:hypothetical protein
MRIFEEKPMTPEQLNEKRRILLVELATDHDLEDRLDRIEAILKALNALEMEANAETRSRLQTLEAENTALKAPLVAVRFTRNENPYGEVYHTARVGQWGMELNYIPSKYQPFYLTVGHETQQSLTMQSMDDLVTLLLASRIYSARINGLETSS